MTSEENQLSGTAAFDAGEGAMPTWSELVQEHADSVYLSLIHISEPTRPY